MISPMRRLAAVLLLVSVACAGEVSETHKAAIRAEIESRLRDAYDLSKPDAEKRMLALYPESGPIVSASLGRVTTSRDTLAMGIRWFTENVVANMQGAQWVWDSLHVEVTSPTSAVVTAAYRIPHRTPRNQPHNIAGAMTAVFAKRDGKWVIIQEHLSDVPPSANEPSMAPPDSAPRRP
jgi:hypothetical protein